MSMNIQLIEQRGDLFDAPIGSILVHSCNTYGSWGAGIAAQFKTRYPEAYNAYVSHCQKHKFYELLGDAIIIETNSHLVACLFTSRGYGKYKDTKEQILRSTQQAFTQLLEKLHSKYASGSKEIWMCKINSGLFGVPWEETKQVVESIVPVNKNIPIIRVICQ